MSQTTVVSVKVEELSKYGFKANGRYVGLSKKLPEADKARLVPGAEFQAEFFVADSGKEYLNKIVAAAPSSATKATVPAVDEARAKHFTPKFQKKETVADSEKMSKADWNAKDRSQLIGGLSHDAAAITASLVNTTSLDVSGALEAYKQVLQAMLKIREEVK